MDSQTDTDRRALLALLAEIDEWLGNCEGLDTCDVIEWRDKLAAALGRQLW